MLTGIFFCHGPYSRGRGGRRLVHSMSLEERGDDSPLPLDDEAYAQDDMFIAPLYQDKWYVYDTDKQIFLFFHFFSLDMYAGGMKESINKESDDQIFALAFQARTDVWPMLPE